jgi:hypothetical protein
MCGIPVVTLEGEKRDCENILHCPDVLSTFGLGEEPSAWVTLLRPIISKFISAFDGEPYVVF